jgi:hypothetical protein
VIAGPVFERQELSIQCTAARCVVATTRPPRTFVAKQLIMTIPGQQVPGVHATPLANGTRPWRC